MLIMSCLTSLLNSVPLMLLGHLHSRSGLSPPIPANPSDACTPWSGLYKKEGVWDKHRGFLASLEGTRNLPADKVCDEQLPLSWNVLQAPFLQSLRTIFLTVSVPHNSIVMFRGQFQCKSVHRTLHRDRTKPTLVVSSPFTVIGSGTGI